MMRFLQILFLSSLNLKKKYLMPSYLFQETELFVHSTELVGQDKFISAPVGSLPYEITSICR